ncbi:hypothetical protein [Bacillus benzoevorans]|uniref:Uncharacterized protein n=1 Tax=Bacillus benzoevorans TaxID=1456 RepID=A0A7X0HTQ8_9BACI|nr:hypothetical protein [Bacillus benzoevorans]
MKVKRRNVWTLLVGITLCVAIIILSILYFPRTLLIDFLLYEDQPEKADVIILISCRVCGQSIINKCIVLWQHSRRR